MKKNKLKYFRMIRDFFEIFLPNQKGASKHTIKNYKICMNQFLDFAKNSLGVGRHILLQKKCSLI